MSFRRFKIGLTVLYQALLSTCLFPQLLVVTAERDICMRTMSDRCARIYEAALDAQEETSNQEMCTALASYLRCVEGVKKSVKSCNSNLYYHTISTLIPRLMEDRSCGNVSLPINQTASTTAKPVARMTSQPACVKFKHKQIKLELAGGQLRQSAHQFRLCALFGDPHLKTFTDERQTCVVQGAWPLIDNDYFSVQVTNVPVVHVGGSSATATNMITVLIKPKGNGCVHQKIYRAEAGSLPAEFLDGTSETGPSRCPAKIYPRRKGPRSHIEIKICYISTTIIIRQVGEFLTFHVKIPEQLLFKFPTTGLCVTGCPHRQRIDYRELLSFTDDQLARLRPRRSKMTRREAYAKCNKAKITGFYLDSCLFDLLTTGDVNFSAAAWHALDDSFLLDEMGTLRDLQTYNTTEPREDNTPSETAVKHRKNSSERTANHSFCKLWTMLIILFVLAR